MPSPLQQRHITVPCVVYVVHVTCVAHCAVLSIHCTKDFGPTFKNAYIYFTKPYTRCQLDGTAAAACFAGVAHNGLVVVVRFACDGLQASSQGDTALTGKGDEDRAEWSAE